jgi:hypothetical protein
MHEFQRRRRSTTRPAQCRNTRGRPTQTHVNTLETVATPPALVFYFPREQSSHHRLTLSVIGARRHTSISNWETAW